MERGRWRPVAVSLLALVAIHALPLSPGADDRASPTLVLGVSVTAPPSPATTAPGVPAATAEAPTPSGDDATPARAEVAIDTAQLLSSEPAPTPTTTPPGADEPRSPVAAEEASLAPAEPGLADLAPLFDDLDRLAEAAATEGSQTTAASPEPESSANEVAAAEPAPAMITPPRPYHLEMADHALAEMRLDWQALLPDWRVEFLDGRTGYLGSTWPAKKLIEVYVRPLQSPDDVAHILAHEIGHAVDVSLNSSDDRARWREVRGIAAETEWFVCCGRNDFSSPAGDFAESFAVWQVGAANYRGRMAEPPNDAQLAVMSELVLS